MRCHIKETVLFLVLLLAISSQCNESHALEGAAALVNPTCSLKDNCNLEDNLVAVAVAVGGESIRKTDNKLESKIASVFENKINYSLKLFADDTLMKYDALSRNLTAPKTSMTPHQTALDADVEEDEKVYVYNIGQRFMAFAQPFDASHNPQASAECREHTRRYLEGLQTLDMWAMKMHDATGKLSSGILNGNINQPGDFDQCVNIQSRSNGDGTAATANDVAEIKGQYCLAYVQPVLLHKSRRLQEFFQLLQSHEPFRSEFNDPGHRVPRYSLINWGICVPASCTYQDVEYSVKEFLNNMTVSTGIGFKVRVEPQMCQFIDNKPWDRNTTWAVCFFLLIVSICVLSTIYDRCVNPAKTNEWLTAFSLDKNLRWLFSTKSTPDDIATVHGLRFLNAVMLLLSHKSMAMFFNPYNNRTEMSESLGRSWTVIGRAASLYTDPFLLFSGMLTAYSLFGRLNRGQPLKLRNEYISRFMRIVPPLAALILFCTYVLPLWGSGPQWNLVIGHHASLCKKNWWRNLLFIHNYFGFSEMCLTHTHHLGIDTELFAVAPLMILAMWKWPRRGSLALILLCVIGTCARYYTTVVNELSNYIYFGTNIRRLFRTADYMYSFPPHRSTVYIMGIFLGYGLRKYNGIQLSKTQLRLGWFVATSCFLGSLLGPAPMGDINYQYNSTHAAIYAALGPIAWCTFFSWIVFVSHNGYRNKFTNLFAWRGFQVSTKLSYALYLTQFPVFFYNVGRRRHIHHYYNFIFIILDTNEFISIFIASVALTILFDAPFQNMKKLILKRPSTSTTVRSKTDPITTVNTNNNINSNNNNSSCDEELATSTTLATTTHAHFD